MRKVLITGENGFIGRSLKRFLKSKSFNIVNLGDINDLNLCNWEEIKKIPKVETIIHLASNNFIPEAFQNPLNCYNNNIISTLNILEKAKIEGSRVIFFSTYVYGPPLYLPIDELHKSNPQNPYTQSKVICEELCKGYSRDFDVPVTIFRPFNIYGPGQNASFFIPTIISQINNKIIHLDDSRPKRDFLFIDDVIEAVYLSLIINGNSMRIYNLGSGNSTSVLDIANLIIQHSGSTARIKFSNRIRQGEILDTIADITKIKNELGWLPKVSLARGLESCILISA